MKTATLKIGNEYDIIDQGGNKIGNLYVLATDIVDIFANDTRVKTTTIERATAGAKAKGHTFRLVK